MSTFKFPSASQAQIIRANQRDLFHVAFLREQAETLFRTWFGTRWLLRWEKELELCAKLVYFGLTTARASQTLGEEYTDIWQQSWRTRMTPSSKSRLLLTFSSVLPSYVLTRIIPQLNSLFPDPRISILLRHLPRTLEVLSEINLAVFYFYGTYYNLSKRLFCIRHISSAPQNPDITPPSYSLLGLMLSIRLIYRLVSLRSLLFADATLTKATGKQSAQHATSLEPTIDARPISSALAVATAEEQDPTPAEEDENTIVEVSRLEGDEHVRRRCTLCLEERTSTCATECGHLFCWSCVVKWGREKLECPLCRQSLNLTRLLPLYNL